uniref:hypothetical protein n=1 Tax=Paludisphaera soli TaxID=2712865 RepID=UPI0013ED2466
MAMDLAREAHEDHFPSRRGTWFIKDLGVLCVYNNNPYAGFPSLRDEELAEFRRRMDEEGLQELASAGYPPEGEVDAGYTHAMIVQVGEEKLSWVAVTMGEILRRSHALLERADTESI